MKTNLLASFLAVAALNLFAGCAAHDRTPAPTSSSTTTTTEEYHHVTPVPAATSTTTTVVQ